MSGQRLEQPAEVATKVLRRAHVSKMARNLQIRLNYATVKCQHGWENQALESIEPQVEQQLKRKRPASSQDTMSDTSSCLSDRFYPSGMLSSSPLTAPMFSDDFGARSGSSTGQLKRLRYQQQVPGPYPASSNHTRKTRASARTTSSSWKATYKLPESSPVYHRRHAHYQVSHIPSLSFISEAGTINDDQDASEDDDSDLPVSSFRAKATATYSRISPPRTPPPELARSARLRNKAFTANANATTREGEAEGADLLLFLATSPSPAMPSSKRRMAAPATPPSKSTPLPSSHMTTPGGGGGGFLGFGPMTPSTAFNFADFVNITPSPAQGRWTRTPIATKTPLAAKEARRRLNFDALLPPTGTPNGSTSNPAHGTGLGMELGGDLIS